MCGLDGWVDHVHFTFHVQHISQLKLECYSSLPHTCRFMNTFSLFIWKWKWRRSPVVVVLVTGLESSIPAHKFYRLSCFPIKKQFRNAQIPQLATLNHSQFRMAQIHSVFQKPPTIFHFRMSSWVCVVRMNLHHLHICSALAMDHVEGPKKPGRWMENLSRWPLELWWKNQQQPWPWDGLLLDALLQKIAHK